MNKRIQSIRLLTFGLSLVLFFVAERYLSAETYYVYLHYSALALMTLFTIMPLVWSVAASRQALQNEAKSWRYIFAWQLVVTLGVVTYVVYGKMLGNAFSPDTFAMKALLAGWLILLILGIFAGIGLELAHKSSGTGELAEATRVARAGASWVMVGMFLIFVVCINYAASQKDKPFDWSYLKTATPGEATVKTFQANKKPVTIAIFYPEDNDVLLHVRDYFSFLASKVKDLDIQYYDKDLHPTKAEDFKVSNNGQVIFKAEEKSERLDIGDDISEARSMLKKLDAEVQKVFLRLTEDKKTLYFTTGHGEFSWQAAETSPLGSINLLERFLRSQNYTLKTFGVSDGSTTAIPADAAAVIIVGPQSPFMKEEVEVLKTYLSSGGHVAALLDISKPGLGAPQIINNSEDPLLKMLHDAGLKLNKKMLANDKNYVSATKSPADRWFVFSNSFTAHESVASLSKHDEKIALLLFQAGYFDVTPKLGNWKAYTTVRALSDTFVDDNKNFTFDTGKEQRNSYAIGVAAVLENPAPEGDKEKKPEGKIIAIADANVVSDAIIKNPANAVFISDSIKWLLGKADLAGETITEEDVKIQHTRKEDVYWFYGTVVGMPLLVLVVGFFATRRRRGKFA